MGIQHFSDRGTARFAPMCRVSVHQRPSWPMRWFAKVRASAVVRTGLVGTTVFGQHNARVTSLSCDLEQFPYSSAQRLIQMGCKIGVNLSPEPNTIKLHTTFCVTTRDEHHNWCKHSGASI